MDTTSPTEGSLLLPYHSLGYLWSWVLTGLFPVVLFPKDKVRGPQADFLSSPTSTLPFRNPKRVSGLLLPNTPLSPLGLTCGREGIRVCSDGVNVPRNLFLFLDLDEGRESFPFGR